MLFADSELDNLPEIESFKASEVLLIVEDIAADITVENMQKNVIDNGTGFEELGRMIYMGILDISHYKVIFLLMGRFDLTKSTVDYSDVFRYCLEEMRIKNNKAIIVLCPCLLKPSDSAEMKSNAHGRGVAMALFAHENTGYAFCRPGKVIMDKIHPIITYYNNAEDINADGLELLQSKIAEKLNDGHLFHMYKYMANH